MRSFLPKLSPFILPHCNVFGFHSQKSTAQAKGADNTSDYLYPFRISHKYLWLIMVGCMLVCNKSYADDQFKLRYNLEVGQKFKYTIENTQKYLETGIEKVQKHIYEFEVLERHSNDSYTMSIKNVYSSYFDNQNEIQPIREYDSGFSSPFQPNIEYVSDISSQIRTYNQELLIIIALTREKFVFRISNSGEILSIENVKAVINTIRKKIIETKQKIDFNYLNNKLGEHTLRNIIGLFFHQYYKRSIIPEDSWQSVNTNADITPLTKQKEWLKDNFHFNVAGEYSPSSNDRDYKGYELESQLFTLSIGDFYVDRQFGLATLVDRINHHFSNNLRDDKDKLIEEVIRIKRADCLNGSYGLTTVFAGNIKDAIGGTMRISWRLDPSFRRYESKIIDINASGDFKFEIQIEKLINVSFRYTETKGTKTEIENPKEGKELRNPFIQGNVLLEPGDSIYVSISLSQDSVDFSGTRVEKNRYLQSRAKRIKDYTWGKYMRMNFEEKIRLCDSAMNQEQKLLLTSKKEIGYEAFQQLYFDNVYHFSKKKLATLGYDLDLIKIRKFIPLDSLINNDRALCSTYYIDFLDRIIQIELVQILDNIKYYKGEYYLCYVNFTGRTRYYMQANKLYNIISAFGATIMVTKTDLESIYNDFVGSFPNSEIAALFKDTYETMMGMLSGEKAPDFTLISLDGEIVSLKDLHGKIVYLTCYGSPERILDVHKFQKEFQGKDVVFIYIVDVGNMQTDQIIDSLKSDIISGIYIDRSVNEKELAPFRYLNRYPSKPLIIDRNGNFTGGAIYMPNSRAAEEELEYFLNIPMVSEIDKDVRLKRIIFILIGVILLGSLIWASTFIRSKVVRVRLEEKKKKTELELRALRSQMNPHFLFNSLSSIQNLINNLKIKEANIYLSKYAGLMRSILNNSKKEYVTLDEELSLLKTYIELESLRFVFKHTITVDESIDIYNTEIPGMILQPYVENAIIHGIAPLEGNGEIEVRIDKSNDLLICRIEDNGTGIRATTNKGTKGNGMGMDITRERLEILNKVAGQEWHVEITDKSEIPDRGTGTIVEIAIPLDI